MIYLLLSILISSLLFVIFKLFKVYEINTLQAIVTNYLLAFLIGVFTSEINFNPSEIIHQPWFFGAIILALLFVSIFNIMALTAQNNGLSVASISAKMSLIIPIIFGVILYDESLGTIKIIGIILALIAVYLTSKKNKIRKQERKFLIYPILLFIGAGCIDTLIKYVETTYVKEGWLSIFLATIFCMAFIIGSIIISVRLIQKKTVIEPKNIIGGITLAVPNYLSIILLLKALKTEGLESSTIFTINNVGIVVLTIFLGLLLFKEKLQIVNWIGVGIAVISIILVTIT